jgi:hypothetical protein
MKRTDGVLGSAAHKITLGTPTAATPLWPQPAHH